MYLHPPRHIHRHPARSAAAALLLSTALLLSGCGGTPAGAVSISPEPTAAADEPEREYLHGTVTDGILTVAVSAACPPYLTQSDDGYSGLEADLAAALAASLGLELKMVGTPYRQLSDAVREGTADLAMGALDADAEVPEGLVCTDSYLQETVYVAVRSAGSENGSPDDEISVPDLSALWQGGLTGAVISGSAAETRCSWLFEDRGLAEMLRCTSPEDAIAALTAHEADFAALTREELAGLIPLPQGITLLPDTLSQRSIAAWVSADSPELLDAVNTALAALG